MTWVVGMPALLSRVSSDPLPSRWRALYRTLSGQEGRREEGRRGGSGRKGGGIQVREREELGGGPSKQLVFGTQLQ